MENTIAIASKKESGFLMREINIRFPPPEHHIKQRFNAKGAPLDLIYKKRVKIFLDYVHHYMANFAKSQ